MKKISFKRAVAAAVSAVLVLTVSVSPAFAALDSCGESALCSFGICEESVSTCEKLICRLLSKCFTFCKDTSTEEPAKPAPELPAESEKPDTSPEKPDTSPEKPDTSPEKPDDAKTDEAAGEYSAYVNEILSLVNDARRAKGLGELKLDTELTKAAMIRAEEQNVLFGHTRPDGSSYYTVLENGARRLTGENVAIGQTSAKQAFEDWMNSPGHRGNILSAGYTSIGIGVAKCTASGYTGFCWAQMFAG